MYRDLSAFVNEVGLPDGLKLYDCNGQTVFPVYGASGGITADYIAYILETGVGHPTWDGKELGLADGKVRDYGCGWKLIAFSIRPWDSDLVTMTNIMDACLKLRPWGYMPAPNRTVAMFRYLPKIIQRKVKALLAA